MSIKVFILAMALGSGVYAVSKAEPPLPAGTMPSDSTALASVSFMDRLQYSVGSVGSAIVGSSVRKSVEDTEQSLADLRKAIKMAKGSDGVRARDVAKKIMYMDSAAVENLHQGHPIKAMKQSMEAKSLLNAVRRNLNQGV
jgi:hypothetical protein